MLRATVHGKQYTAINIIKLFRPISIITHDILIISSYFSKLHHHLGRKHIFFLNPNNPKRDVNRTVKLGRINT